MPRGRVDSHRFHASHPRARDTSPQPSQHQPNRSNQWPLHPPHGGFSLDRSSLRYLSSTRPCLPDHRSSSDQEHRDSSGPNPQRLHPQARTHPNQRATWNIPATSGAASPSPLHAVHLAELCRSPSKKPWQGFRGFRQLPLTQARSGASIQAPRVASSDPSGMGLLRRDHPLGRTRRSASYPPIEGLSICNRSLRLAHASDELSPEPDAGLLAEPPSPVWGGLLPTA